MLTDQFWFKPKITFDTNRDKIFVIPKFAEFRPDTISLEIYGSDAHGIEIMVYNNIIDPFKDLYAGRVLKYPPFDQLSKVV